MPVGAPTLGDPVDVGDLVARVQRDLRGSLREPFDLLAGNLAAASGDASVDVTYGVDALRERALVGIGEETLLVRSVAGLTVTFARGIFNTNIVAHTSGDVIEVDPAYFPAAIGDVLVEEIRSWPLEVGRVRTADISFGATDRAVDWAAGPTGFRRLLASSFLEASDDHPVDIDLTVTPNASTSLFASGYAISRTSRIASGTARLVYLADFTLTDVSFSTTLSTIGLPATLYDAAVYGALWRLLSPREVAVADRTAQPQPRQSSDTPPGRTLSAGAGFKQLRDQRIEEEVRRLRDLYPPRTW